MALKIKSVEKGKKKTEPKQETVFKTASPEELKKQLEGAEEAQIISEESIKAEPEPESINVSLGDQTKDQKGEQVKMDFGDDNFMKSFVRTETKSSGDEEDKPDPFGGEQDVSKIRERINSSEEGSELSRSDFEDIAGFLIELIDTGLVTLSRGIAKDNSDAPYEIKEKRKDRLKFQLSLILMKYKAKFKIEWIFLLSVVLAYYVPFKKAISRRRVVNELDKLKKSEEITIEMKERIKEIESELKKSRGAQNK